MKSFETYIGAHRQEMINALRTLVQYPSVRGASLLGAPFGQPAADALQAYLKMADAAGLRTRNVDGYVGVAEWGDDPALGILSHLDVVPAGDGWTMPPFDLTERDGVLYGRGVIDDKGPTVAALFALRAVIECGVPLKRGVRLIVGCAEETGSEDIEYYAAQESFPPMVFTPDGNFPVI
ncbi:MAG: M20/M25/M40 family metallo-hydrolase, partial [Clostridia bacterium]|nr:M20/M25/M40 family metallo-hydrolase [Clostridia bacterium]